MSSPQPVAAQPAQCAKQSSQVPENLFFHDIVSSYVDAPRFVRRDWLAHDLQRRLDEPGCRFVSLTGEPGCGKSGFIAQLAADHPDWPVYFIRRDQKRSLGEASAKSFLLRIGFQMAALFPEAFDLEQIRVDIEQEVGTEGNGAEVVGARIGKIRASPFQQVAVRITQRVQQNQGRLVGLEVDEWLADPRLLDTEDLHEMALFRPARNLARLQPERRIVILVDALDELRYHALDNDILAWLTNCPPLAENIRFVLTSRPSQGALRTFADKQGDSVRAMELDAADSRVRAELTAYAAGLAVIPEVVAALARTGRNGGEFARDCALKADGNIGYLATLGRAVDQQRAGGEGEALLDELVALRQLPDDLDGLYAFFLGQIMSRQAQRDITVTDPATHRRGLINAWTDLYHPVLSLLAVALQPLTIAQLQALTGTLAERAQVSQAVEWLSQFLDQIGAEYRLYHATLAEFLTSAKTRTNPDWSALYVDGAGEHGAIATEIERDEGDAIWRDEPADEVVQGRRAYARSFYVTHLYLARDWRRLFAAIDGGAYGRGKVAADPSTYLYAHDLDLAIEAAQRIPDLPALWRYKLLRSTMAGYADALPPESYAALAAVGRAGEALPLVELVVDPGRQASAMAALARSAPAAPFAQKFVQRGFEALPQLDETGRGEAAQAVLDAGRAVLEASGALAPEAREAVLRAATRLLKESGDGDFARSAAVLLMSGADGELQTLVDAMESAGHLREVCAFFAEVGDIDQARQAAAMVTNAHGAVAALGSVAAALRKAGKQKEAGGTIAACRQIIDRAPDAEIKSALLARLGEIELSLGDGEQAAATYQEALDLTPRDTNHVREIGRLARALGQAGDPGRALQAFGFVHEEALREIAERKITPGQGYTFSLAAVDAGILAADLDQTDAALDLARQLQPWEQYSIVGAAVGAMARRGDLDRALETTARFAELASLSPVKMQISGVGGGLEDEPGCMAFIAEKFAERADWGRAVEVAARISSGYGRYRAYSLIALRQQAAGLEREAADLMAREMREVRLQNTDTGKDDALSAVVELLLDGGHTVEAGEAAEAIQSTWGRSAARQRVAEALVEAGESARAETYAESMPPANRAAVLVAMAKKQAAAKSPAVAGTLDRAREIARTIEEGAERSQALRDICLGYHELAAGREQAAVETMHEAATALNQAETFRFRPTPWPDMFLVMAKIGQAAMMANWLKGLVDFDSYDGCCALLKLAEHAWRSGDQCRADDWMSQAKVAAARTTFPPMQSQLYADIAHRYAQMGRFAEARAEDLIKTADRASKGTAMKYVAQELANAGRLDEAYEAIKATELASLDLVDATIRAGDPGRALEYVRTFHEDRDKTEGLARVASAFATRGDHGRALALMDEARAMPAGQWYGLRLLDIAKRYVEMGERQLAAAMVANEWRGAPSRRALIERLGAGRPLVADVPPLGAEVHRSFRWVEEFLAA